MSTQFSTPATSHDLKLDLPMLIGRKPDTFKIPWPWPRADFLCRTVPLSYIHLANENPKCDANGPQRTTFKRSPATATTFSRPPTPRSSLIGGKPFLPVRGEIVPKDHRTPKYLHHQRPICTLGLLRPQHLHQTLPTTPDSLRCWVCRLDLDSRVGRNRRHLRPTAGSVALTWPCTNQKKPSPAPTKRKIPTPS